MLNPFCCFFLLDYMVFCFLPFGAPFWFCEDRKYFWGVLLSPDKKTKRKRKNEDKYFRLINLFFFKWIFSSLVFILETVYKICFLTYFLPSKRTKFSLPSKTYFILKQILSENIEHHYLKRLEFCLLNIKLKLEA